MHILKLDEIKNKINLKKIIAQQEEGFKLYSKGLVNVPSPGYIEQSNPKGNYHLKYGYIKDDSVWITKIAGGPHGLPINGLMLAIDTQTGTPSYLLQDNGYLTQLRTAVAGLIAAKYLANKDITNIGIIGTGQQARLQVEILKYFTDCKNIVIWGRDKNKAEKFKNDLSVKNYNITVADTTTQLTKQCNLIVTTTSAREPLLKVKDIQPGTHITAMGADSPGKQELDPEIFKLADIISVDSRSQCIDHGEIYHAYHDKLIQDNQITELGNIIANPNLGRQHNQQITVADLTGVAIQDIQIVKSIIL